MNPDDLDLLRGEGGVDPDWYRETCPDVSDAGVEPALHYLTEGWKEGRDPHPAFSTRGYLEAYPDVAGSGMNPLIHFLKFGRAEGRGSGLNPAALRSAGYEGARWRILYDRDLLIPRRGTPPPRLDRPFGEPGRRKLVFAGHEASRTGAPLLLLELMKLASQRIDAELYLFLERPGELLEDYASVAHVVVNGQGMLNGAGGLALSALLGDLADPVPHEGMINSAASIGFLREMAQLPDFRVMFHLHEGQADISSADRELILEASEVIAIPSEASRRTWIEQNPRFERIVALHHGLLNPDYGKGDRAEARCRVREELGLAPETFLVLASGVRNARKGVDLFLQVARCVAERSPRDVHFVWLGSYANDLHPYHNGWIEHDRRQMGLEGRVHLLETRANPEPFALAADVFLMTSRDDSFPFVVQESMACGVPVIAFRDAGGAVEAIAEGTGLTVPYLAIDAMADAVIRLLDDPKGRERMGRLAREHARRTFRFDRYAERVLDLAFPGNGTPTASARGDNSADGHLPR